MRPSTRTKRARAGVAERGGNSARDCHRVGTRILWRGAVVVLAVLMLGAALALPAAADPSNRYHFNENRKFYEQPVWNLRKVGHDPAAPLASDVWAHEGYAYIASWISPPDNPVRVYDVLDPKRPAEVAQLLPPANTRTNDIKVTAFDTPFFQGDLAIVSNEPRPGGGAGGIQLFDVTEPRHPVELARFDTGARGVHNIWIDGTFAYLAGAEDGIRGRILWIVDIANPADPKLAAKWFPPEQLDPPEGMRPSLHDMTVQDGISYLAYIDSGLILLDVSDPFHPEMLGQYTDWETEPWATHTAVPNADGSLTVVGDEVFACPSGFFRLFDTSDPTDPKQIAIFAPPAAVDCPRDRVGDFTMHNAWIVGDLVFVSWYSYGVRVLDISNPEEPVEVGFWVPPAEPDPFGIIPDAAQVWGVYVDDRGLVYLSDQITGLWILEPTGQLRVAL